MKQNTKTTHLNSNIENVGSDLSKSEVSTAKKNEKTVFRNHWWDRCCDFDENLDEVMVELELNYNLRRHTVFSRYTQFFNNSCQYAYYFEAAPLLPPIWNAFLDFENGSENHIIRNPKMFREQLYTPKKEMLAHRTVIGL
jgi:hypothetical protein